MRYSTMVRCVGKRSPEGFFTFLDHLQETPFDGVNLAFRDYPWLFEPDFDCDGFLRRFQSYGLEARFAHAPFTFPSLFDRSDFRDYDEVILKGIDLAAAFGVNDYTIHPGSVVDDDLVYDRDASVERNLAYLRPFVARGVEKGVRIGLENGINQPWDRPQMPLKQVSPDIDELILVVDALRHEYGKDAVGVCFDTGHAHLAAIDLYDAVVKIGDRLTMTHIHDNGGDRDEHLPVGEGTIAWDAFRRGLEEIGYDDELSLELYYDEAFWEGDVVARLTATYRGLRRI